MTGHPSITERKGQPLMLPGNLESLISLMRMERSHTGAGTTSTYQTNKDARQLTVSNPGPFCYETIFITTAPLFHSCLVCFRVIPQFVHKLQMWSEFKTSACTSLNISSCSVLSIQTLATYLTLSLCLNKSCCLSSHDILWFEILKKRQLIK